jgi:ribosomal protein S18 acetylase RimI-like enzyme
MQIDIESLERATLDAVAPLLTQEVPGWLLPLDFSHIGRATSAVPLVHAAMDATRIADIEMRYAAHKLSARFRVADVIGLAGLHGALLEAGYTAQQPTLTQVGSVSTVSAVLEQSTPARAQQVVTSSTPTDAWKAVYTAPGFDATDGAQRVQALSRSETVVYASISDAQGPLAAGTASFSHGWASFHGMRTVPHARGQGLARRIMAELARMAQARGLDRAFLQVEEDNTNAIALYGRLGFQTAWRYHYWRKPSH